MNNTDRISPGMFMDKKHNGIFGQFFDDMNDVTGDRKTFMSIYKKLKNFNTLDGGEEFFIHKLFKSNTPETSENFDTKLSIAIRAWFGAMIIRTKIISILDATQEKQTISVEDTEGGLYGCDVFCVINQKNNKKEKKRRHKKNKDSYSNKNKNAQNKVVRKEYYKIMERKNDILLCENIKTGSVLFYDENHEKIKRNIGNSNKYFDNKIYDYKLLEDNDLGLLVTFGNINYLIVSNSQVYTVSNNYTINNNNIVDFGNRQILKKNKLGVKKYDLSEFHSIEKLGKEFLFCNCYSGGDQLGSNTGSIYSLKLHKNFYVNTFIQERKSNKLVMFSSDFNCVYIFDLDSGKIEDREINIGDANVVDRYREHLGEIIKNYI